MYMYMYVGKAVQSVLTVCILVSHGYGKFSYRGCRVWGVMCRVRGVGCEVWCVGCGV